jgi:hypothetical protein
VKDYGSGYSSNGGKRQKVIRRTASNPGERHMLWRAAGMVLMLATAAGVAVSLWFGYQINATLDELAREQEKLGQAQERNVALQRLQEELLARERIESAVGGRGLRPPIEAQIRKM